jgi:CrcB protein
MGLFLFVCLGGALGTAARYLLGLSIQAALGSTFPYGTLSVNLIGSFLIALLMYLGVDKGIISNNVRVVLTTGVMGGFTTYSSFNYETMRLFQQGSVLLAFVNMGVTLAGCLVAGGLGLLAGRLIGGM